MKIAVLSDLHGKFIPVEEAELMLICGDIFPLNIQTNINKGIEWLENDFMSWIEDQPINHVIFIAGNHDFILEYSFVRSQMKFSNHVEYLHHHSTIYTARNNNEYHIFGTPYCKQFGNWAFMRNNDELKTKYNEIPENLDILLTHDAPYLGGMGKILEIASKENVGNPVLTNRIEEVRPKYTFCGHIHSGDHELIDYGYTIGANVSILNESYNIAYPPLYLEI